MPFAAAQLASAVGGELMGDPTVLCSGAEIDTRRCVSGKVFFALRGTHSDGHEFLDDAIANGCSAVVVDRRCSLPVPVVVVQDPRRALSQLAKYRREHLQIKQAIAITGSVGKTTTKELLAAMLGTNTTASILSFNNDLGVPLTILEAETSDFLVCEVGASAVGEIEPLAKLIQPDISILTSIEKAHLEGFGDMAMVLKEKSRLLESTSESGLVVVSDSIDLTDVAITSSICRVGTSRYADIKIKTGINAEGYAEIELAGVKVTLSLFGEHNANNAALAVVAAEYAWKQAGEPKTFDDLLKIAATVQGPKGRLNKITVHDLTFFDDTYNANPASMRSSIQLFSSIKGNRKVMILGDMLELGESSHAEHHDLTQLLSSSTDSNDLVVLVGSAMEATTHMPAFLYESTANDEAMLRIASLLQPNDVVLLKGSRGLRLERVIELKQQMKVSSH